MIKIDKDPKIEEFFDIMWKNGAKIFKKKQKKLSRYKHFFVVKINAASRGVIINVKACVWNSEISC